MDQTLSGGANLTPYNPSVGAYTVDCGKIPAQWIANTGAFTITAPAADGECVLQIENGFGAGAVTWSGFSEGTNTGDALTTTNGNKFQVSIIRIHSIHITLFRLYSKVGHKTMLRRLSLFAFLATASLGLSGVAFFTPPPPIVISSGISRRYDVAHRHGDGRRERHDAGWMWPRQGQGMGRRQQF